MKRQHHTACPYCGGNIKADARACPHCGSDEETGWSSYVYLDGIDLHDEDSYEETRRNEFGEGEQQQQKPRYRHWFLISSVLLLFVIVIAVIRNLL